MDGTLYDTERIYERAWQVAGVTRGVYLQLIGRSRDNILRILEENGYDGPAVRAQKQEYVREALRGEIPLKPGVRGTLRWLRERGFRTAVATSSSMDTTEEYLMRTGMREDFTKVVSGQLLEHGKPAPDIFLLAAKELSSEPARCMVVEDSFNGVRAGHAAGMYTVMIPDLLPPDEEIMRLADAVLDSMEELAGHIGALCGACLFGSASAG